MGLPGSGKTYLAERLVPLLNAVWLNADSMRKMVNDWDFSEEGRRRQSKRMRIFADFEKSNGRFVVCDFVCPTMKNRNDFDADFVIWMNTINKGRYEDTNSIFMPPKNADLIFEEWREDNHSFAYTKIINHV